jgi:uncharacterized membrane protein
MAWIWQAIRGRPWLFIGLAAIIVAWPLLPATLSPTTRGILAWDIGVLVFLLLSAQLFAIASPDEMPAAAEAQQEGEWTIFWITLAVVIVSFIAISSEFATIKGVASGQRTCTVTLVAATLFLSWLATHATFAFRYPHELPRASLAVGCRLRPGFPAGEGVGLSGLFLLRVGYWHDVSGLGRANHQPQITPGGNAARTFGFLFNTVMVAFTVNIAAGLMGKWGRPGSRVGLGL